MLALALIRTERAITPDAQSLVTLLLRGTGVTARSARISGGAIASALAGAAVPQSRQGPTLLTD